MQSRNLKIDVIRGIAILCVVWAHLQGFLTREIYIFHMPVFFFISGIFYRNKPKFILSKAKSLLIPYCLFNIAFAALYLLQGGQFIKRIDLFSCTLTSTINGPTWFLIALFNINIIYWILDKLIKKKKLILAACFAIAIPLYYWNCILPFDLRISIIAMPFFALGKWAKDESIIERSGKPHIIIASIIYVLTALYCHCKPAIFDLHGNKLPLIFITYYASALSAILILMKIDWFSQQNKFNRFFASIGKRSLYIMSLHYPYMWTLFNFLTLHSPFSDKTITNGYATVSAFLILSSFSFLIAVAIEKLQNLIKTYLSKHFRQEQEKTP